MTFSKEFLEGRTGTPMKVEGARTYRSQSLVRNMTSVPRTEKHIDIEDLMDEFNEKGHYSCPGCGGAIEIDGECGCGEPNPFIEAGLV